MDIDVISMQDSDAHASRGVLSRKASAVQFESRPNGATKLGLICQLPPGAEVELCGDGYSDRTVKVRYKDHFYFVFRNDIVQ